jgi:hypothetical protein
MVASKEENESMERLKKPLVAEEEHETKTGLRTGEKSRDQQART